MGKKYIIKLDDNNLTYTAIMIDGVPYIKPLQLLPYTEPDIEQAKADAYLAGLKDGQGVTIESQQNNAFNDGYKKCLKDLEQIRKEAYEEGYKTAKIQCGIQAEKDMREVGERHYQRGLSDAWEAARKIIRMPEGDLLNVFTECYSAVCTALQVILKYDATEAIEKLKAYEQEKDSEIKVGDEVELILNGEVDSKAVFLEDDEGYYRCLFWTGCCFTTLSYPKEKFRKTGRHFDDIATILEKMRGEQDG